MSVGSLEPGEAEGMAEFANFLNRQHINGLAVKTYVFDSETHESVVGACISRTLREFHGRPATLVLKTKQNNHKVIENQ